MSTDVPKGWTLASVADVADILDSRRVPLNSQERRERQGSFPYWGANGVVDHIDGFIFDEPLVLMAEDGGYFDEASTRPICHRLDGPCWVNNHAHVIRPTGVDRDFFYYWFVHRDITPFIKGGTRSKLNQADLKALPIHFPSEAEQWRIAGVLRSVDEAITLAGRAVDQAELTLASAREHLTGQDGSEPNWTLQPLINCFQLQRGHDLPVQNRIEGSVPVIASNGPVGLHNHAPIPAPAVITGRSGTIGKVTYFNGPCWPLNTTLFVRDFKGSDPRFVYHFLSAFPLLQHATGTGVPTLNRNDVHAVEIYWPEQGEQNVRAEIIDSLEVTLLTARAALKANRTLKATLANDIFSGRVRVPE